MAPWKLACLGFYCAARGNEFSVPLWGASGSRSRNSDRGWFREECTGWFLSGSCTEQVSPVRGHAPGPDPFWGVQLLKKTQGAKYLFLDQGHKWTNVCFIFLVLCDRKCIHRPVWLALKKIFHINEIAPRRNRLQKQRYIYLCQADYVVWDISWVIKGYWVDILTVLTLLQMFV